MSNTLDKATIRELLEEVRRRTEHVDALFSLVRETDARVSTAEKNVAQPVMPPPRRKGSWQMKAKDFFQLFLDAGRPLTVKEMRQRMPRANGSMLSGHLRRSLTAGKVEQVGSVRPFAYRLVETQK